MDFLGKDILVVGDSSGLGLALTQSLLLDANRVFGIARRTPKIQHSKFFHLNCDLKEVTAAQKMQEWLDSHSFSYDIIILNSGIGSMGFAQNFNLAQIRELFEVNFFGLLKVFEFSIKKMQAKNLGTVVVISSLAAYRGLPASGAYGSTKAALTSLFESFKVDLQGTKIKIIQVFPYFVITAMSNPRTRPSLLWTTADQAALKILKKIKNGKSSISFPWPFHFFCKLMSIVPRSWSFSFWYFLKRGG